MEIKTTSRSFRPAMALRLRRRAFLCLSLLLVPALTGCPEEPEETEPPIADAGEHFEVPWGDVVVLKGSCTHPDPSLRSQLTSRWDMTDWPVASGLSPEDIEGRDALDAFFRPDAPGPYSFTFQCAVGPFETAEVVSAEAMVTATVLEPPANRPPVVSAGEDLLAEVGESVVLSAVASDPDGDSLDYSWMLIQSAEGSSLVQEDIVGATDAEAGFVPDVAGRYRFLVRVEDGRGGQAEDELSVEAVEVERLEGEITVTVLGAETGEPIEGAAVSLSGEAASDLQGVTGSSGEVVLSDAALAGPVDIRVESPAETVLFDHDGDPETAEVELPRYRATLLTGIDRPQATVLMPLTAPAAATGGRGVVHACIPESLFSTLPELERMFSFAGARMGGQFRMVLVAPVPPRGSLVDVEVKDFLVPSPHAGVPFPGNMGTDDPFMNEYAGQFGLESGECSLGGAAAPFSSFELEAPAGEQTFSVLGGVATLDLLRLLGLLLGATGEGSLRVDLASVLGSIDFSLLFMGFIEVEVPSGGEVDISSILADTEGWKAFEEVPHSTARQTVEICDDSGHCEDLHQVRVFPSSAVTMVPEAPPADPRVEAALPESSPFEVFCKDGEAMVSCEPPRIIDLEVPEDTGTD
ncbi:MAG: PKD domain-containing protein, partial [Myxococcota bacterium]